MTRPSSEALGLKTNMVLRKGATFHSPTTSTTTPELDITAFRPPRLPQRSQTNLDDVIDANRRRAALTLGNIDNILAPSIETSLASSLRQLRDDSLPIPRGILDHTLDSSFMSKEPAADRRVLRPRPNRCHDSDSGLGTSIASTNEKRAGSSLKKEKSTFKTSAITRSAAALSTSANDQALSARSINRIYEHALKPILAKRKYKDFHPLILECPRRIQKNDIVCLRDVEKTLLFLAPVSQPVANDQSSRVEAYRAFGLKARTADIGLYLDFSLFTVRCIQTTVEHLPEREQTRPRDPPYTGGYFIDLVDQIRHYAQQLADAKEKGTRGDDQMDVDQYDPPAPLHLPAMLTLLPRSDEIKLHGGIHINGCPAELVRVKKNGTAVSIATGEPVDVVEEHSKGAVRIKRSLSEQLDDEEEIKRSMARRKKNASPEELAPKRCREPGCNKEFKRPCDLTKHEKTHSRPWKCPVPTCKYHEYGWPTEKEMDRHRNDKHSANPPMYECLYKPCSYKSKRDSNRKQHMEKAHGWNYVRTKSNNNKSSLPSVQGSTTEPTPQLQNIATPSSDHSVGVATPTDDQLGHLFSNSNNNLNFPTYLPHDTDFDMIPQDLKLDYSPADNGTPSTDSGLDFNSTYQDIGNDFTLYEDIYTAHVRVPAPMHDAFQKEFPQHFTGFTAAEMRPPQPASHISPIGQGNAMLFTPSSLAEIDEGFDEHQDFCGTGKGYNGDDFVLFPDNNTSKPVFNNPLLFGEIPSLAAGFSQPNSQDLLDALMMDCHWTNDYKNFTQH